MSIPTPKVEIGFDLTDSPIGPFLRLDDPVSGRLDNTEYRLGGTIFVDVTDRVRNISVNRGKGRRFANFQSGQLNVEFNNHDRAFDPLYPDSPFAGNIIPRREIRVSLGTAVQFTGWIDDWDLSYTPDGNSLAGAVASDAFTILANQSVTAGTPVQERTDERIATVLSDPNVAWSTELRDLEDGTVDVGTQEITANTNALTEYGIRELTIGNLLGATDQQSLDLADRLLDQYSDPEYRVEQLEVNLHDLNATDQEKVLGLELGSVCKVEFTPNGIGDPIERFISVIKIDNRVTVDRHFIQFGFQEIKFLALVLNDSVFGKLDEGTLG